MNIFFIFIFLLQTFTFSVICRSPFRKPEKNLPTVITKWEHDKKTYIRKNRYFHSSPLFTVFNQKEFNAHMLPKKQISYRWEPEKSVSGAVLNELIEELYQEIRAKKRTYTNFTILQTKNFNRNRQCGLLVVKCKKYPFVVKLFLETPKTLTNPYCKGFENRVFHYMGHGANRHLAGLTRIPNLGYAKKIIFKNDTWKNKVIFPRKWYWQPKNPTFISVTGIHFTPEKNLHTRIPAVFAIVADEIDTSIASPLSLFQHHKTILTLCNDMKLVIDPHLDNFIIKKENNDTFKIYIIDTEHFPTIVGIHYKKEFFNYVQWYGYLSCKAINDLYLQTKKHRYKKLTESYPFPWQHD